jgi:hypothetical protein
VSSTVSFSQNLPTDDLALGRKLWGNTSLEWKFAEKFSVFLEPMFGYNVTDRRMQFAQGDLKFYYRPNKVVTLGLSYKPMFIFGSNNITRYDRAYAEVVLRHYIWKIRVKQTIFGEGFFPNLPKYRYRFCYGLNVYSPKQFTQIKLTPFIKGEVYYYLGGDPVSYYGYDENQDAYLLAKNSPNDFHRFRFVAGVTSKPLSFMRVTFYYLYQREFNTPFTENRGLNIQSKNQNFYKIPFNNFHTLGFEIEFVVKNKKKNKKKEVETDEFTSPRFKF